MDRKETCLKAIAQIVHNANLLFFPENFLAARGGFDFKMPEEFIHWHQRGDDENAIVLYLTPLTRVDVDSIMLLTKTPEQINHEERKVIFDLAYCRTYGYMVVWFGRNNGNTVKFPITHTEEDILHHARDVYEFLVNNKDPAR